MNGLASMGQEQEMLTLDEVVSLLMQGMDPQELVQAGVPVQLVQEAVQMIMAQEQQTSNAMAPASTPSGLAMTSAQGM